MGYSIHKNKFRQHPSCGDKSALNVRASSHSQSADLSPYHVNIIAVDHDEVSNPVCANARNFSDCGNSSFSCDAYWLFREIKFKVKRENKIYVPES